MFMTARLIAMNAPRYSTFRMPSAVVAALCPVCAMTDTTPTGPDMSLTDTRPDTRSPRLIHASRAKSSAVYHVFLSTVPTVFSS